MDAAIARRRDAARSVEFAAPIDATTPALGVDADTATGGNPDGVETDVYAAR